MIEIKDYDDKKEAKTLKHSINVFHEALKDGTKYYHVVGDNNVKYDISYKENMSYYRAILPAHVQHLKLYPDYIEYDENMEELLATDFLKRYSKVICVSLSEYSIVVARIVLKYTDIPVYFYDKRALWFLETCDNLHVGEIPDDDEYTLFLMGALGGSYQDPTPKMSDIAVFHSIFVYQFLFGNRDYKKIKYINYDPFSAGKNAPMGIGALISCINRYNTQIKKFGMKIIYKGDKIDKFKVSDIEKYFNFNLRVDDSTDENTFTLTDSATLNTSCDFVKEAPISYDIFTEEFLSELQEYESAIFGEKKILGLMIRGTDYHVVNFTGKRKMATCEQMIPTIREWVERDGYDSIFLATEDQEVLDKMRAEFGSMIIAISQERFVVSDFGEKAKFINELERQKYSAEEYDERTMDTTINYMYALYLLSRCNSCMVNGHTNGLTLVKAFNNGRFEHFYRFEVEDKSKMVEILKAKEAKEKELEKYNIIIASGRIDTTNSAEFENEVMNSYNSAKEKLVRIDCKKLEYISSSGLRVLMKLRKLAGSVELVDVSPSVYEIFETTGFVDILDIKKALREISVDGCEKIGQGAFGTVYRIDEETIVKTYRPDIDYDYVDRERSLAKLAFVNGISTAIAYDVVNVDDCLGIVFEMVKAQSLGKTFMKLEDSRAKLVSQYVELMKQFHNTTIENENIPTVNDQYHDFIENAAGYYEADEVKKLHQLVDNTPSLPTLLHGDFHTKNIMVQDGELVVIDMADVCMGHPVFDFAAMAVVMDGSVGERILDVVGMTKDVSVDVWNQFLKKYFDTDDEAVIEQKKNIINFYKLLRLSTVQIALPAVPESYRKIIVENARKYLFPYIDKIPAMIKAW